MHVFLWSWIPRPCTCSPGKCKCFVLEVTRWTVILWFKLVYEGDKGNTALSKIYQKSIKKTQKVAAQNHLIRNRVRFWRTGTGGTRIPASIPYPGKGDFFRFSYFCISPERAKETIQVFYGLIVLWSDLLQTSQLLGHICRPRSLQAFSLENLEMRSLQ